MKTNIILAIESSCDDTSVALVNTDYEVLGQVIYSQKEHERFGGVLPELASRLHIKELLYLVNGLLKEFQVNLHDISAIAVSVNPGLIGSLIVGLSFAKSLAWSINKPLITVNHMLGHVFANHLTHKTISTPFLALIVSGGHTELVHFINDTSFEIVGRTLDDAAGETFDKAAKLLGLGYPGGPVIDQIAKFGNNEFYAFPRALNMKNDYNFSFSGLKTAIKNYIATNSDDYINLHKQDIAASLQQAIIEPLVKKTINFATRHSIKQILLCGGVAANSRLNLLMREKAKLTGIEVYSPQLKYCMDNAAMIASAAIAKFQDKQFSDLGVNAFSKKGLRIL